LTTNHDVDWLLFIRHFCGGPNFTKSRCAIFTTVVANEDAFSKTPLYAPFGSHFFHFFRENCFLFRVFVRIWDLEFHGMFFFELILNKREA